MVRESSSVIIISWSFSPSLIPTSLNSASLFIAFARSITFSEGIFETYTPPLLSSFMAFITSSTASSRVIQNLVIRKSVIGKIFSPCSIKDLKKGTTDPLLPATLPYLTTLNLVSFAPAYALAETNNLSETIFVAP